MDTIGNSASAASTERLETLCSGCNSERAAGQRGKSPIECVGLDGRLFGTASRLLVAQQSVIRLCPRAKLLRSHSHAMIPSAPTVKGHDFEIGQKGPISEYNCEAQLMTTSRRDFIKTALTVTPLLPAHVDQRSLLSSLLMSCNFTVFPGGPSSIAASWGSPIYLTAVDALGFGTQLPGNTVSIVCADGTRQNLTIIAWTPTLIGAQLPATPPCDGPYQVAVHIATPLADCLQIINVSKTSNPLGEPTEEQVIQALNEIGNSLRIVLRQTDIEPGIPALARLDPFIPGGSGLLVGYGVILPISPSSPIVFAATAGDNRDRETHVDRSQSVAASTTVARRGRRLQLLAALAPGVLPLTLEVTWIVEDESGKPLTEGTSGHYLERQGNWPGAERIEPSFLIAPPLVEALQGVSPTSKPFRLRAMVTLKATLAGKEVTPAQPFNVPAVILNMIPLEIPTVAAFFRHRNFAAVDSDGAGGAILVMIPANSKLAGIDQSVVSRVSAALETLDKTVGRLKDLASFAAFLTGLGDLVSALPQQVYVAGRAKDEISKLGDVRWHTDKTWGIDWLDPDMYVGDRISSLIFLGVNGRGLFCFQNSKFKGQSFEVRITDLLGAAKINHLDTHNPMSTTPGVSVTARDQHKNFDNILSSVKFG